MKLNPEIKRLVVNNAIAYAVYRIAKNEDWPEVRFLEELAIQLGRRNDDLQAIAEGAVGAAICQCVGEST